jgi:hypothetical protein
MKNLKEFKKLIKRYETITLDEIKKEWKRIQSRYEDDEISEFTTVGFFTAEHLTGFGFSSSCTLCRAVYNSCNDCVYGESCGCVNGKNQKTYKKIEDCKTPKGLLTAFRKRAEHLKTHYKEIL